MKSPDPATARLTYEAVVVAAPSARAFALFRLIIARLISVICDSITTVVATAAELRFSFIFVVYFLMQIHIISM